MADNSDKDKPIDDLQENNNNNNNTENEMIKELSADSIDDNNDNNLIKDEEESQDIKTSDLAISVPVLESESEKRCTSASNAGESEYESADDEDVNTNDDLNTIEDNVIENECENKLNESISQINDKPNDEICVNNNEIPSNLTQNETQLTEDQVINDENVVQNIDKDQDINEEKNFTDKSESNEENIRKILNEDIIQTVIDNSSIEKSIDSIETKEETKEVFEDSKLEAIECNNNNFIKDSKENDEVVNEELEENSREVYVKENYETESTNANEIDEEFIDEEGGHEGIAEVDDDDDYEDIEDSDDCSVNSENNDSKQQETKDDEDLEGVREEGDGEESSQQNAKDKAIDHDEDKRNPQYIPKRGPFYEHDDRMSETTGEEEPPVVDVEVETPPKPVVIVKKPVESEDNKKKIRKKLWNESDRWGHDMFNEDEQIPKSKDELVQIYGYDIRNEDDAPKAMRRRRYGRGPTKYTRQWQDENAYGKGKVSPVNDHNRSIRNDNNDRNERPSNDRIERSSNDRINDRNERSSNDRNERSFNDRNERSSNDRNERSSNDRNERSSNDRNERSFNDRNERSFNDRNERSFSDRNERSFNDRNERSFSDRNERSFSDRNERSFSDRNERSFSDRNERSFSDRNERSFNERSSNERNDRERQHNIRDRTDRTFRSERNNESSHRKAIIKYDKPMDEKKRFETEENIGKRVQPFSTDDFPELAENDLRKKITSNTSPQQHEVWKTQSRYSAHPSGDVKDKPENEFKTEPMKIIDAIENSNRSLNDVNSPNIVRTQTFENSKYSQRRSSANYEFEEEDRRGSRTRSRPNNESTGRAIRKTNSNLNYSNYNHGREVTTDNYRNRSTGRSERSHYEESNRNIERFHDEDSFRNQRESSTYISETPVGLQKMTIEEKASLMSRNNESEQTRQPKRYSSLRQQHNPNISTNSQVGQAGDGININSHQYYDSPPIQTSPYFAETSAPHNAYHTFMSPTAAETPQQTHPSNYLSQQLSTRYISQTTAPPTGEQTRYLPPTVAANVVTASVSPVIPPLPQAGPPPPVMSAPPPPSGPTYIPSFPSGYPQFPPVFPENPPQPPTHVPPGYPGHVPPPQPPTPLQLAELYRGGVTYYDPQSQQQHTIRQIPQRRPKAAIPIVPPPDPHSSDGDGDKSYVSVNS